MAFGREVKAFNKGIRKSEVYQMKPNMKVNIAGVELANPIITASGTFSLDMERYFDFDELGAVTLKGVFAEARQGNPSPRIAETASGMINSVGLQGEGVDYVVAEILPKLARYKTKVIANVCGNTPEEFADVAERFGDKVDMLELNVSCPNVKSGGIAFGLDPCKLEEVVVAARKVAKRPIIVKLSPNVTSIADMAKAAESGGADVISLVNTLLAMRIDVRSRKPINAINVGGLSGAAIKPIAVRMVWQAAKAVSIPVIGMGGIMSGEDVAEFMLAGASAVMVGTASLITPDASVRIKNEFEQYLIDSGIKDVKELVGGVIEHRT